MSSQRIMHGVYKLKRLQKRRRHGPLDLRTKAAQNALQVRLALIQDQGGDQHASEAARITVEMIARDVAWLDEVDGHIADTLRQNPKARKNPRVLERLYRLRQPMTTALSRNLALIGLDKIKPPAKSIMQILEDMQTETEAKAAVEAEQRRQKPAPAPATTPTATGSSEAGGTET